jgi:hypothetical protein
MKRKPTVAEPNDAGAPPSTEEHREDSSEADAHEPIDEAELDEPSDLDSFGLVDIDDRHWDVFILDDDDGEELPDYGDFWMPD